MELIINSPKYGKHIVLIDDEDFEKVKEYAWNVQHSKSNGKSYVRTHSKNGVKIKEITLPRLVLSDSTKKDIDHINGNTLDNRKSNLRACSRSENCRNRGMSKNNSSGYKGIFQCKKRWQSSIMINRAAIYIGSFATKEEAALAYNKAAIKYHGEFACLNEVSTCL